MKKVWTYIGVAAFWLAVWQLISMLVAQELLVPAPLAVLQVLCKSVITLSFWKAVALSMLRVAGGFAAGVVAGVLLAVATVRCEPLHHLLAPLLHCIKAAPVASFIILALVWIPTGFLPVFICFLMVLPIVWSNVEQGIRETDVKLLEMAKVYRLGAWRTWLYVRVPSVMPYLVTALTTGLGFAWKSGVAAEVICQPGIAIGKQLYLAKMYLETPEVFAWTAVVIVMSVLLERLLKALVFSISKKYGYADRKVGKTV